MWLIFFVGYRSRDFDICWCVGLTWPVSAMRVGILAARKTTGACFDGLFACSHSREWRRVLSVDNDCHFPGLNPEVNLNATHRCYLETSVR